MRSRAAAVAVMALVAVLPTAGCYQAYENTVSVQGPTGNGVDVSVGPLLVQDTTLVASEDGKRASLIFTIVNDGDEADSLNTVTVTGGTATIRTAPLAVAARSSVAVGGPNQAQVAVAAFTVPTGNYAEVKLSFRRAGSVTVQVPVVPGEGYYASYAPNAGSSAVR
jgi:hypothetical protein